MSKDAMKETVARQVAPQLIAEIEGVQANFLSWLTRAKPGHELAVLADVSTKMPGMMAERKVGSGILYLSMRRPLFGESPPIAGVVSYVSFHGASHQWVRVSGRVRLLRHAVQRWIQRDGGVDIVDLSYDLSQALAEMGLILSVWPPGPIILPTAKGAYFGRLCKGETNAAGKREPNWIELWTFTELSYMFRAPAEIRRRFQEEVLGDADARKAAEILGERLLTGEPALESELATILPIFASTRDLIESAAWKRHLDARRRMGDDVPD